MAREEGNFLKEHHHINTFIIINESQNTQIDYVNCDYKSTIKKYDNLFTADIINEYIGIKAHLIHVIGTIGYSADTEDVEFVYDKTANFAKDHKNDIKQATINN